MWLKLSQSAALPFLRGKTPASSRCSGSARAKGRAAQRLLPSDIAQPAPSRLRCICCSLRGARPADRDSVQTKLAPGVGSSLRRASRLNLHPSPLSAETMLSKAGPYPPHRGQWPMIQNRRMAHAHCETPKVRFFSRVGGVGDVTSLVTRCFIRVGNFESAGPSDLLKRLNTYPTLFQEGLAAQIGNMHYCASLIRRVRPRPIG